MATWRNTGESRRLDALVSAYLGVSVGEARRLIQQRVVRVNGKPGKKGDLVAVDATIEVRADVKAGEHSFDHEVKGDPSIVLEVVYEDEHLFVVNKPAGLPSHPLRSSERGTVAHGIVAACPACATASMPRREGGLVHRLDRGTTGVLIAAKTPPVWERLRAAFTDGEVEKIYWALVHGVPVDHGQPGIVVDAPLATRRGRSMVLPNDPEALPARTELRVLAQAKSFALVEARARTGRLHQIRAHLAHLGHPLVGDTAYGATSVPGVKDEEALLHARVVTLPHPVDGWRVTLSAPLPPPRRVIFERLLGKKNVPADRATPR